MTQQDLHDQIKQLHEELSQTESIEPKTQQLLARLEEHIRPMVDDPNADNSTLADRLDGWLDESIASIEAEHPILTTQIKRLVDALSNMGI